MLYQCDLAHENALFKGDYNYALSSDDQFDLNLPLNKRKAKGGTMIMWKIELDAYITCLSSPSSSFLPILFTPPTNGSSLHISIYLPTSGHESQFLEEISNLHHLISNLMSKFPDIPIFIRGDANVNPKNKKRMNVFKNFCSEFNLQETTINHTTYHHFMGDGSSDSQIDVLLHTNAACEKFEDVICKKEDPTILSHHDVILSRFYLATHPSSSSVNLHHPSAPRIDNNRAKIHWSQDGANLYLKTIGSSLSSLRDRWSTATSEASFSILLNSTYSLLDKCARLTNKSVASQLDCY